MSMVEFYAGDMSNSGDMQSNNVQDPSYPPTTNIIKNSFWATFENYSYGAVPTSGCSAYVHQDGARSGTKGLVLYGFYGSSALVQSYDGSSGGYLRVRVGDVLTDMQGYLRTTAYTIEARLRVSFWHGPDLISVHTGGWNPISTSWTLATWGGSNSITVPDTAALDGLLPQLYASIGYEFQLYDDIANYGGSVHIDDNSIIGDPHSNSTVVTDGPFETVGFDLPEACAVDQTTGDIYVSEIGNTGLNVRRLTRSTRQVDTVYHCGFDESDFPDDFPGFIEWAACGPDGRVYFLDEFRRPIPIQPRPTFSLVQSHTWSGAGAQSLSSVPVAGNMLFWIPDIYGGGPSGFNYGGGSVYYKYVQLGDTQVSYTAPGAGVMVEYSATYGWPSNFYYSPYLADDDGYTYLYDVSSVTVPYLPGATVPLSSTSLVFERVAHNGATAGVSWDSTTGFIDTFSSTNMVVGSYSVHNGDPIGGHTASVSANRDMEGRVIGFPAIGYPVGNWTYMRIWEITSPGTAVVVTPELNMSLQGDDPETPGSKPGQYFIGFVVTSDGKFICSSDNGPLWIADATSWSHYAGRQSNYPNPPPPDEGPSKGAGAAFLDSCDSIAIDAEDNVYVPNDIVLKVTPAGQITQVAGRPRDDNFNDEGSGLDGPSDQISLEATAIAVSQDGRYLFTANFYSGGWIYLIDTVTGWCSVIAGGAGYGVVPGPGKASMTDLAWGLGYYDKAQALYYTEFSAGCVMQVTLGFGSVARGSSVATHAESRVAKGSPSSGSTVELVDQHVDEAPPSFPT